MKKLLLLLAAANGLLAQNSVWIDLKGPWQVLADQDKPEFASPDFDDSAWQKQVLPVNRLYDPTGWMRKRVDLTAVANSTSLVLILGTIQKRYEVFVNGTRVGGNGSFNSLDDVPFHRPQVFDIPQSLLTGHSTLLIAVRFGPFVPMHPVWRMADRGPYLIADRASAPLNIGTQALDHLRYENSPQLVFAVVFFGISCISLIGWLGDRSRTELLWFALLTAIRSAEWFFLLGEMTPSSLPFRLLPDTAIRLMESLTYFAFARFVLLTLDRRSRALMMTLCLSFLTLELIGLVFNEAFLLGIFLCVLLTLGVILWDCWQKRPWTLPVEELAIRLAMLLLVLWSADHYTAQLLGKFQGMLPLTWSVGVFEIRLQECLLMVVCVVILVLLFRRITRQQIEAQRLAGEFGAARSVQQLLLSRAAVTTDRFVLDTVYQPANEVGGDFWQSELTPEGNLLLLSGDVSGKGLKAAMVVSMVIGAFANRRSNAPGALLGELNRALCGRMEGGFVTCCCALIATDGSATLANAGNPAPYCDGLEVELEPSLPLGIAGDIEYAESQVKGSRFTFISDGVVEAENAQGELFGFDRTCGVSGRTAQQIVDTAVAWGQNDDITVVTVRTASILEEVE